MDNTSSQQPRLHPAVWIAAVSVTVASLVAVGAMTGLLPKSQAENSAAANAAAPLANTSSASLDIPAPAQAAAMAPPPPVESKPAHHKHPHTAVAAATPGHGSEGYAAVPYQPPLTVAGADAPAVAPQLCHECGIVESVRQVTRDGKGSGVGAVAGGVLGGLLGNGVGQGNGRKLAALAGIVGGAYAGNKVDENMHQTTHFEVAVRFDDGSSRIFSQDSTPRWHEGDRVKFSNGVLTDQS